jgi:hypothetical protein
MTDTLMHRASARIRHENVAAYQRKSKNCGQTGPLTILGVRHTFGLGPAAFDPGLCCLLASTLVHEAVHGLGHLSQKRPEQVEKDCFGCTVPEKP